MSLCYECKSTLKDKYIKCDCGYAIDYDCLIIAGILPNDYNNLTQSKYALHLLSSPYFKFICKTCINSNDIDKSNSISDSDSMNSLNNLSSKINEMHSDSIINDSDNDDINNSSNTTPTYSDILRINNNGPTSTSSIYNKNHNLKSQSKAVNLIPSIVIEHISSSNRNIEFIKKLFISIDVDPNTIKQLSFRSHFCNIILSSPCASDALLRCRSLLAKCPLYDKLFIRPYLEWEVVKMGRLFYHVFKSELLPGYKSIFNYRTNVYEIRKLKMFNDKSITDWKSSAYIPTADEIIKWEKSLSLFISSKKETETDSVNLQ